MSDYKFNIEGRLNDASDPGQADSGLLLLLKSFGFQDLGDGRLWFDRPEDQLGFAGVNIYIHDIVVSEIESPPLAIPEEWRTEG